MFPQEKPGRLFLLVVFGLFAGTSASAADRLATVSEAVPDPNGFLVHTALSPFQSGPTEIRVLLPITYDTASHYPVVYVLPVETGNAHHYGDGLLEVKNRDLHRRFSAIFVAPTFSQLPWYADHPSDPDVRQESHFLKVVIPFVSRNTIRSRPVATDACSSDSASRAGGPTACSCATRTNSARRPPGMLR